MNSLYALKMTRKIIGLTGIALFLIAGSTASAQSGGDFAITSFSIDNGGGVASGGEFSLVGVIGQPDAGPTLTGGDFTLTGGFLFFNEDGSRVTGWSMY